MGGRTIVGQGRAIVLDQATFLLRPVHTRAPAFLLEAAKKQALAFHGETVAMAELVW